MKMQLTKNQEVMQQVISKAWQDEDFRQQLIATPVAAIEQLTGEKIALPKGKTLAAYDQSNPDVVYLNIPPQVDLDDVELTDSELELVAGGVYPIGIIDGCFPPFPPDIYPFPMPPLTTW